MHTAKWVKLHGYISMFFFPLALIYAITGALVIFGEYGNLAKEQHSINIAPENLSSIEFQQKLATDFLQSVGEEQLPQGKPRIVRGSFYWGRPSSINLSIVKSNKPGEAILHIRRPDLLFSLIILHKAKGGRLFDYFGFVFALAMIFMYVSGIFIFWKIKSKRLNLSITFAGGLLLTIILIYFSL